jgi:multidrug efflux system outer membrane protein
MIFIFFLSFLQINAQSSFAQVATPTPGFVPSCSQTTPSPSPTAAPPVGAKVFHVNPDSIRTQLLENNVDLELAYDQTKDAKDQVISKALSLLPSVSLSMKGSSFMVSEIQFLLPFLMPSNWFNAYEQEDLYKAQLLGYKILELNTYSSALAVYYTVLSDFKTTQVYEQQATDLQTIANVLNSQAAIGIGVSQITIDQAAGNANVAVGNARNAQQAIVSELAALKSMLGFSNEDITLVLDFTDMPASSAESQNIQDIVNQAVAIAPELGQIQFLEKASNMAKWSNIFSFIGSTSMVSAPTNGAAAGIGSLQAEGSVSLGASIFPNVAISNRNTKEIALQQTMLIEDDDQIVGSAIQNVALAKNQFQVDSNADVQLGNAYTGVTCEYVIGVASIVDILNASQNRAAAELAKISAELDLSLLRITLHRALLTDQFAKIEGCKNPTPEKSGFFHRSKQTI